jgi:enoyl-CoA hydratase/carnithine racemase/carbon monoxide dehydrogenase subunit G
MEMKDEIRIEAARDVVWTALNDPDVLKACIPGCETLEQMTETEFVSLVVVKVGPIKAKFSSKVSLHDIVPPCSYRLIGEGQGGVAGFAKSEITVELFEDGPDATILKYGVTANIGGKIAQLGSRLIDSTARKMAEQFFARFNAEVCPEPLQTVQSFSDSAVPAGADVLALLGELACGDHILVTLVDVVEQDDLEGVQGSERQEPGIAGTDLLENLPRTLRSFYTRLASHISERITGKMAQPAAVKPAGNTKHLSSIQADVPRYQAAVVTLNRPTQRNAVSLTMWRELGRIFTVLGRQPQVRAIILTGTGPHFSAGADITEFATVRATVAQGVAYEEAVDACCDAMAATPQPTIAVINGFCMGGACHLAMSCDFRYAQSAAQFAIPAARLSIVYGVRGVQRLLALVGISNAKHILYSAKRFTASEGQRIGFLDHVSVHPMRDAKAYAGTLADNAPLTIAGSKVLLNGLTMDLGVLNDEAVTHVVNAAVASADYRDARQAFVEKRRPVFVGS